MTCNQNKLSIHEINSNLLRNSLSQNLLGTCTSKSIDGYDDKYTRMCTNIIVKIQLLILVPTNIVLIILVAKPNLGPNMLKWKRQCIISWFLKELYILAYDSNEEYEWYIDEIGHDQL